MWPFIGTPWDCQNYVDYTVCAVYDYSKRCACHSQDETQSKYFDMAKVSLHVNILYRHATEEADGIYSTKEAPEIVKEFVLFISDYAVQDNDSVHKEHWNGHISIYKNSMTAVQPSINHDII